MYEELVKQCRDCIDCLCGECKYEYLLKSGNFVPCMNALLGEAADAIEELSDIARTVATIIENEKDMRVVATTPNWIPVAERLSIKGRVLCFGDNGIRTVDFVCGDKWCVLPWFYLDGEQETGVTHWMPLPPPPKEET